MAIPNIGPADARHIEVVATGLPVAHGLPVVVDATLISPLHADGSAWEGAARKPGASFARVRRSKSRVYPELENSQTLSLVVAAMEVGGRMSSEGLDLLHAAAAGRSQSDPPVLRKQAARAW